MFSKNQKISHSQLYCQMFLTCAGVFLLSIPGEGNMTGRYGIWNVGLATAIFCFYSIYLVRISGVFSSAEKYFGRWGNYLICMVYLIFLWHSGVFLLLRMEQIVECYLLNEVPSWIVVSLAVAVCYLGSAKGLQRRGRMAQASVPLLAGVLCMMFLLALREVKVEYLYANWKFANGATWKDLYGMLAAYTPFGLLPFTLKQVERPARALRTIVGAVITLGICLCISCILLQGTFGLKGTGRHTFPMIDLMAGVGIPGKFLERMDVFWIIFLIFSLFFALGSVFFYTGEVLDRIQKRQYAVWMTAFVGIGALYAGQLSGMLDLYGEALKYMYLPLFFLIGAAAGILGKRRSGA